MDVAVYLNGAVGVESITVLYGVVVTAAVLILEILAFVVEAIDICEISVVLYATFEDARSSQAETSIVSSSDT